MVLLTMYRTLLSVAALSVITAIGAQAASSCFTAEEVRAANLRVLQQQFNVAALNCQTNDPANSFAIRYNRFVERFGPQMQRNSAILNNHFGKNTRDLDHWITHIANDAGQLVITKADFCQVNWDRLGDTAQLPVEQIEAYAVQTEVAGSLAPPCPPSVETKRKKGNP
jgi:hypothetical protein